ncbi:Hypoxia-inducible factor 1-alpha inhibitor [Seminavis robusta]|uniref:Hypoxia-inducible factor 1-alpha inhibitor n=1 Tax=Seminavis robusta TaxID=568900 RepID=A0A9N8HVS7_9STRA|nr:Hypoxia-inducible factor 1-alpha inhibitor [Seminavis robusta]|eukprot:Sro1545_g281330.1 Hypoxia-inducible factor 1-alpha inhibitor (509) ;mRNA; r:17687-19213
MPKRPTSPSATTCTTGGSTVLHKTPIFWVLLGLLSIILLLTLPFMYSQLETIQRDDDPMQLLGSSVGDGWLQDEAVRRFQHHRNKRKRKHEKLQDAIPIGMAMGGGDGGDNPKFVEAIHKFAEWKHHEAKRRKKRGIPSCREEFEERQGYGSENVRDLKEHVRQTLRVPDRPSPPDVPYNIYNCPDIPPRNYPYTWNTLKVLGHWNPDDTEIPPTIHQSLCVFDWETDQDKALAYRDMQVPFVLQNVPEVMKASMRWTSKGYLDKLLGDEPIRNEHSLNNHFMYWKTRHPLPNFEPPTEFVKLTYPEWYQRARHLDEKYGTTETKLDQVNKEHWYFRLNAMLQEHGMVYEELPFFDPSLGETMTMVDPTQHRGINCRFGMKGVIAETHFDSSTNFIALMGGQRRYILAHPDQCINMELYPQHHPSGRHSSVNWSTAAEEFEHVDRPFSHGHVNEVVLQAGDLLYLPTYWFHFIVSLNMNYQCNSRSGVSHEYDGFIADCGFGASTKGK